MDKVFTRNIVLFVFVLVLGSGLLAFTLYQGNISQALNEKEVQRTNVIISQAEEVSTLLASMISDQRGYLLTGEDVFLKGFEKKRSLLVQNILELNDTLQNEEKLKQQLHKIQPHFNQLMYFLETEIANYRQDDFKIPVEQSLKINQLKNSIIAINDLLLQTAYSDLNTRIESLDIDREKALKVLFTGVVVSFLLLLLFNAFLFLAQKNKGKIEGYLKDTQDRLAMAIDATQDGIYDWDLRKNTVFYSRQYWKMLGFDKDSFTGTLDDFKALLHPDDSERTLSNVRLYLNGQLSEYNQEFRMRHKSGRWIWVKSQAKAILDDDGQPYRVVGAHSDITYLKQINEKLRVEKELAERANSAKTDFLAHMSHEIRTPLTSINGIADIFLRKIDSFDKRDAKLVRTLKTSTASLKNLISDILDFAKIESGELDLDYKKFNLNTLLRQVTDIVDVKAKEKGIALSFKNKCDKKTIYGDCERIKQILINLVGNAAKFTDEGSVTLKVELQERDGQDFVVFEISDTGVGIEPEHQSIVFERFKQADTSVTRRHGGTGLGLPISRNLARLMGGDIFIKESTPKGSMFVFHLPLDLDETSNVLVKNELARRDLNKKVWSLDEVSQETRALLVEDHEPNITVISYILDDIGILYDVVKSGRQAISAWEDNRYDFIFMDVQMPGMDGFTATKIIRKLEEEKGIEPVPIIGMTAHALVGDKNKCIEAGMSSYLPKPLSEEDLRNEISKYV